MSGNIILHRKFHLLVLVNVHRKYFEPNFNPNNTALFSRLSELAHGPVTTSGKDLCPSPCGYATPPLPLDGLPGWRTGALACSVTPPGNSSCPHLEITLEGFGPEQRLLADAIDTFLFPMSQYHLAEKQLLAVAAMWLCSNFCVRYKTLVTASLFPFLWGLVKTKLFELSNTELFLWVQKTCKNWTAPCDSRATLPFFLNRVLKF